MRRVLIPGAAGRIAQRAIPMLVAKDDLELTLLARDRSRLAGAPRSACVIEGDVLDDALLAGTEVCRVKPGHDYSRRTRTQLPDEAAAYVRELIFSGQVRPGEFLRMEPIADAVGVSTTPVREGLLTLASEGFVRLVPRRGFVVASFSPQDIRDIFWVQAQLAGELTARASTLITPGGIAELEKINEAYDQALELNQMEGIADLGRDFHLVVNRVADSHRLASMLESVVSQLPRAFYSTIEGRLTESQQYHAQIFDAFRRRQTRQARTLMSEHILCSADYVIDSLDERGFWGREQAG